MTILTLSVNGRSFEIDVAPDMPLLWAIRENIGLTGTKYGCGIAQCGACTVHVEGETVRACGVQVADVAGKHHHRGPPPGWRSASPVSGVDRP